ncbi:hypothetical protein [Sulfuricystis multivorans]|uniref:hypothetical protein n=1 Tax=Sulfuricystis multivorans TaxID=2211108 RepID=UPI000F837143|nr:hypothetical protein [Sulfuricystis multivorans]
MSLAVPIVTYPSVIARACAALDESPVFHDLPDGYFRVVVRIIKKINLAHAKAPILASRATLARESGKSVETVGRVVKWLEDRGLIQRERKARPGLRGSSSPIIPTRKLLDALLISPGLAPSRRNADQSKAGLPADKSSVKSDGSISRIQLQAVSTREQPDAGPFVRIEGKTVPSELAWLVRRQGLAVTALLALMKLARQARQRLSHVVSASRKYLEKLQGRALFAYVKTLLGKDKDYSWLVKEESKALAANQERERLERKALELRGRRFASKDGRIVVEVMGNGVLLEERDGVVTSTKINMPFLDAIEAGRLLPIH